MLKNYLSIALRNLRKHKGFSLTNILGLAVSMSVCLLIIAFLKDQRSYDQFHAQSEQIYRITSTVQNQYGLTQKVATSPAPLANVLRADYPIMEKVVQFRQAGGMAIADEATIPMGGLYAEQAFFEVFDFSLLQGVEQETLTKPFSMVLTPEASQKVFGESDPVGQVLTLEGMGDFTITGILQALPHNTHFAFEFLASFSTLILQEVPGLALDDWSKAEQNYTYVQLAEGVSKHDLEVVLPVLVEQYGSAQDEQAKLPVLQAQALTSINLGESLGNQIGKPMPAEVAWVLGALALIVMLTACFNYVSLSVARSLKRAKEIGVRKVAGAHRPQIIVQFLGESILLALVALGLALVLFVWLVPFFNDLHLMHELDAVISPHLFTDWKLVGWFLLFAAGTGILAGLYPALHLSAFSPIMALKGGGKIKALSHFSLRKSLIVLQFSLSLFFIISTLVVYQQFAQLMEADYGFHTDDILNVELQGVSAETFGQEVARHPGVQGIAAVSSVPAGGSNKALFLKTDAMTEAVKGLYYSVDQQFLGELGLPLLAGRNFSTEFASDEHRAVIINERALTELGLGESQDALGAEILVGEDARLIIIGVVANFFARGVQSPYEPVLLRYQPEQWKYVMVRYQPGMREDVLAHLTEKWEMVAQSTQLEYTYYEAQLRDRLAFFGDIIRISGLIAGFAIFIACLGLLGMAGYTTETRVKEVGIRKVLGASVSSIVVLLSRSYLGLLAVAIVLTTPLSWLLASQFLQGFEQQVSLSPWIFVVGVGAVFGLVLTTVCSQTAKAALLNPTKTLRAE